MINRKKTVPGPVDEIRWLGKNLKVLDGFVAVVVDESAMLDVSAIAVLAVSSRRKRCMQAVVGMLNWLGVEHRRCLPFLQTAYKWLLMKGRKARNQMIWTVLDHLIAAIGQLGRHTVLPTFMMNQESVLEDFDVVWWMLLLLVVSLGLSWFQEMLERCGLRPFQEQCKRNHTWLSSRPRCIPSRLH